MIEILVALAILGILIIPIGSMVSSIIDVNKRAQDNIKTAALMSNMVEYAENEINAGFDEKKLKDYAERIPKKNSEYKDYICDYEILLTTESNTIQGVDNTKSDVSLSIKNDKLNVHDIKNDKEYDNINLDNNKPNKIQIKVSYIDDNKLKYLIKNETTNDEFYIETTNPDFGIDFDDMNIGSNLNIKIYIDGVYDAQDKLISNKFIVFRHRREESPVIIISQTSFVIISKTDVDTSYQNEGSVIKTKIVIMNRDGKVIREQIYYFTKRFK